TLRQSGALGRGPGRTLRARRRERLRVRRSEALAPSLRRDGRAHHGALSALVLRELPRVCRSRARAAVRSARAARVARAAPGVHRERRAGSLGRSERRAARVPRGEPRLFAVRTLRHRRVARGDTAQRGIRRPHRVSPPPRRARPHHGRFLACPRVRGAAPRLAALLALTFTNLPVEELAQEATGIFVVALALTLANRLLRASRGQAAIVVDHAGARSALFVFRAAIEAMNGLRRLRIAQGLLLELFALVGVLLRRSSLVRHPSPPGNLRATRRIFAADPALRIPRFDVIPRWARRDAAPRRGWP